ncbi:MAG TPA: hypothetical protein VGN35_13465 [Jatrophihabitantaceae bacterium]|nr:hypothetical protein [Jatrophihabitantaceae bacterium]
MRVYLPATTELLRALVADGELGPAPLTGFAVTPGLREWYVDDDIEELEYAASLEAARASLRLVDADPSAARRRVVVAADVPDTALSVRDDLDRGVVQARAAVSLADIASVHIDDADAESAVAAAAEAVVRADLGDSTAQDLVDDVEGFELSWYATQEIAAVLGHL